MIHRKITMKPLDDAMVNILTELIEKYQVYKSGDLNSHRMRDAWKEVSFMSSCSLLFPDINVSNR